MQLFVEHLTVIDCAYLCATHGLVGESWICDILLEGELDTNAMVMDFGHVKKAIKNAIDLWVDHRLLVPAHSPQLNMAGDTLTFRFNTAETLTHRSPEEALCILPASEITIGSISEYLEIRLRDVVPESIERIQITLRNEPEANAPFYHYAHGLKKHDGNCQRIAHGHRSRLQIINSLGDSSPLTDSIAATLDYRYIGSCSDILGKNDTHTHFCYDAPQGRFELSYPTARCHILDTDSTVECIASHLAAWVAREAGPGHTIRAYEGVMKGAIAYS